MLELKGKRLSNFLALKFWIKRFFKSSLNESKALPQAHDLRKQNMFLFFSSSFFQFCQMLISDKNVPLQDANEFQSTWKDRDIPSGYLYPYRIEMDRAGLQIQSGVAGAQPRLRRSTSPRISNFQPSRPPAQLGKQSPCSAHFRN